MSTIGHHDLSSRWAAVRRARSREPGADRQQHVLFPGEPAPLLEGLDRVGFLDASGRDTVSIVDVATADPDNASFALKFETLPDGYELIVGLYEVQR